MRWLLGLRVCIIISIAVMLIAAAVLFSTLRAMLPFATGYKQEIQQEISRQLDLPIEIESLDATIHWFSPALRLINVRVYDEARTGTLFQLDEAFVELDVISSVLRGEIIVDDVGLIGSDISIERLSDSEWTVQGIRFTGEGDSELPERFIYILLNSDYLFHNLNIYYRDHTGDKLELRLLDVNIDVENAFGHHDVKFSMRLPPAYGEHLAVVASLHGDIDDMSGDLFVEVVGLRSRQWNSKFKLSQAYDLDTVLDVNSWIEIDDNRIDSVIAELSAQSLNLRNNRSRRSWSANSLRADLNVYRRDNQWHGAIADLVIDRAGREQWPVAVDIIASQDEENYYLSSNFLRAGDVREMVDVIIDDEQLEQLAEFDALGFDADIYNLKLKLPKVLDNMQVLDAVELRASVADMRLAYPDQGLSIEGFDSDLQIEQGRILAAVASEDVTIEMNELFRNPLTANAMQGDVRVSRQADEWLISTDKLLLSNSHVTTFSRLQLNIGDDGVYIDAQTDFFDAYGRYTSNYVPAGIMGPELVKWLDMAVVDGYVPQGTFIMRGEPASFPFLDNQGIFQVMFEPRDVTLKFLEGWPVLVDAGGKVLFENMSMMLEAASAKTADVSLYGAHAEIRNLQDASLQVSTSASASNQALQSYVWNSGLDDLLGDALRLFQFGGNSEVSLDLGVALKSEDKDVRVDGQLTMNNAEIDYPALGYRVSNVNGLFEFSNDSIFADSVGAVIDGQKAMIDVVTRQGLQGRETFFDIRSRLAIDYLAQQYPWIPEHWFSGRSQWEIGVAIPYDPVDYLVRVEAESTLQGTVIDISDTLRKRARSELELNTEINILGDHGLQVRSSVRDGDNAVVDVFANRDSALGWTFDVSSEHLAGRGAFNESLDKDKPIVLDLSKLDADDLFINTSKRDADPIEPALFPPLQVKADSVKWKKWNFTDVVLDTSWHKHGMLINTFNLRGQSLEFDARGTWLQSWRGQHETVMSGAIKGDNCGRALAGLGYEVAMDRCDYSADFNAKWAAEPYNQHWENTSGSITFGMDKGIITNVDPGTGGRLIGLLNLFKLANRLTLNFDDVTQEGFSFDYINGSFDFVNGDGSLSDVNVSAPAADINMFGRIGLIDEDYGLLVRVKPHTDTLTFAGGALLGGVAVGAGLALLQNILKLGGIGYDVYSITGPWEEPVVEQIVQAEGELSDLDDDI